MGSEEGLGGEVGDRKQLLWVAAALLAVIAIAPVAWLAYNNYFAGGTVVPGGLPDIESESIMPPMSGSQTIQFPFPQKSMQPGSEFYIKEMRVQDGYVFSLKLENDVTISATLSVATREEATRAVVEMFRSSPPPPPTVTLLRKVAGYWVVDIHLVVDGLRVDLKDVLRERDLLLCEVQDVQDEQNRTETADTTKTKPPTK